MLADRLHTWPDQARGWQPALSRSSQHPHRTPEESDDLPDSNGIDKPEGLRSSVWCQCLHRRVCREAQRFAGQGGQGCTVMVRVLGADSQGQGWSLWVRVGEVRVMRSHGYGLTVTFPGSGVRGVIRAGEPATQTPGPIVLLPLAEPCGPHGAVPGCRLPSKPGGGALVYTHRCVSGRSGLSVRMG